MKKSILYLILSFVFISLTQAQSGNKSKWSLHTKSKKAVALYTSAEDVYAKDDLEAAIDFLDKAIAKDNDFIEAYLLKADIYFRTSRHKNEIECITKALEVDSMYFVPSYYNMGVAHFNIGEYDAVKGWMNRYVEKVKSEKSKDKHRFISKRRICSQSSG